ncbi:hypothetical protein CWB78_08715 [Pseudoalteromonas sp. S1612]|nr:hypothetical protein CWB78_08715 [Pseudoalteromonas sp. S1612]
MKRSNNQKTKKKQKIKHANISNIRMLLNLIAFSLVFWALGLLSILFAIKFIHDGYILTPTDYRVESDVYFFSATPFTYLFYLFLYLGTGIYFLAVPYLFRDMFPRKKKKPDKNKKKYKRGKN